MRVAPLVPWAGMRLFLRLLRITGCQNLLATSLVGIVQRPRFIVDASCDREESRDRSVSFSLLILLVMTELPVLLVVVVCLLVSFLQSALSVVGFVVAPARAPSTYLWLQVCSCSLLCLVSTSEREAISVQ